jgi:hypothetical protein
MSISVQKTVTQSTRNLSVANWRYRMKAMTFKHPEVNISQVIEM